MRSFQISGGPKWVDTARFDIDARLTASDADIPDNPGLAREDPRKAVEALRSLLAERFLLTFHHETREQSSFELVVAKGGPRLHESTESKSFIRSIGRGLIKGQAVTLRDLVLNLANQLARPVIDNTGLTGKYTFELKWDANPSSAAQLSVAIDPDESSIFTPLQEQLGLRLESQKGPVNVVVIDRAERPSEN